LTCGNGCREAARVLGLLGLPNDTTMESRSFGIIEDRISPALQKLGEDVMLDNLTEEVRLTVSANDFKVWKDALDEGTMELLQSQYPAIGASYDMAWQQRNSVNRYNSPSGHRLLVGARTRKPIAMAVKSKYCNYYCKAWKKQPMNDGLDPPPHNCCKNHDGSSSSMEPVACLEMVKDLHYNKMVNVGRICCDANASTRSMMQWSNADFMKNSNTTNVPKVQITKGPNKGNLQDRPDRGKLPAEIPEPLFVADPNHRRKVFTGELIALAGAKVADKATMTRMDSTRLGKNFGYMVRALKTTREDQYMNAGRAVLEHHVDDHSFCGPWCARKRMTEAQRQVKDRYYRSKTKDVSGKLSRFVTLDRLKEVAHRMDTQVNESFNNTASWFAPKNKVYCGSQSLRNRLSIAIGINTLGLYEYYKRLFAVLDVPTTKNIEHFLRVKDNTRNTATRGY
jgi:hypothetical protein